MPSGSSKNKKGGGTDLTSTTEVCALCCDTLKKGQDVLKCEGSCGCNVHRYCAGVTKLYFDELVKGSIPFVCQYCALKVYKAIVQQLQDEVASLKLELAETKSLCERRSQTHPPASYASVASKEPPSKQPAKHGGQKGQKGQRPPAKQPTTASTGAAQPPSRRTAGESRSVNSDVSGPRVRVDGAFLMKIPLVIPVSMKSPLRPLLSQTPSPPPYPFPATLLCLILLSPQISLYPQPLF